MRLSTRSGRHRTSRLPRRIHPRTATAGIAITSTANDRLARDVRVEEPEIVARVDEEGLVVS
eukprot:9691070-Heterocapsa_arctica.AAC.1